MEETSWFFVIGCFAFTSNMAGFVSLVLAMNGRSKSRMALYTRWLSVAPFVFLAVIPSGYLGWMVCAFSSVPSEATFFAINGVLSSVGFIAAVIVGWVASRSYR